MGVTGGIDTVGLDVNDMVFNKKQLLTSLAEPAVNFPLSIQLIQSGRIDVRRAVTHTLPLRRAQDLRELYDADSNALKTVITCG